MRVATRRQRAAWRVFGRRSGPAGRSATATACARSPSRLGTVRDLDVLLEAADLYRADLPVAEQRALEPMLRDWRGRRDDARVLLVRELDSGRYQRWVDDYRDFVRTEGAAVIPVGPTQPHRVRDTAPSRIWAAYEQVRALRTRPALGRCRDAPRAPDRRQVAALHARVRARGARARSHAAARAGHRAPGPPRPDERRRRRGVDGPDVPRRARRRPLGAGERGDRPLPGQPREGGRPAAPDDRASRGAASPASGSGGPRAGRLHALAPRASRDRQARQPWARSGSRSRHAAPDVIHDQDRALADPGVRHADPRRPRTASAAHP